MIVKEFPPNYGVIVEALGDVSVHKPVFAYGGRIYNPFDVEIGPDLIAHESKHLQQQGSDPDGWWIRYLHDDDFRLEQEIEGYGEQVVYARNAGVRGAMLDWLLDSLARSLSSDLYGGIISFNHARCKIRNYGRG